MSITLGLVANVFNEVNALPGWLETHLPHFDDVCVTHAGPGGKYSTDGTIELLEKWKIPVKFDSIDEGFGAVRTRTIRHSKCDYVMLLDADERFNSIVRLMVCTGESTPQSEADAILQTYDFRDLKAMHSNWENIGKLGAKLTVTHLDEYDQMARLRETLNNYKPDAVVSIRRHWHDLTMDRPTQNWHEVPDWQMRIVRQSPTIFFDPNVKMHEHLQGAVNVYRPCPNRGPFFDHHHFYFKKMEPEQRAHDVDTYDRIHRGESPLTEEEFYASKRTKGT